MAFKKPSVEVAQTRPWLAPNVAMVMGVLFVFAVIILSSTETLVERVMVPGLPANTLEVRSWLKAHPIPAGKGSYPVELTRTSRSSVSVVQLRVSEQPHVHLKHDLAVTVLRGYGDMCLGTERRGVSPGEVILIPAGITHAFVKHNEDALAVALAVFSPPFDGKDVVQVEEKGASK